jgi:hypothetical protein
MASKFPAKDPADVLDEKFDWREFLDGDTITTATVTVAPTGQLTVSGVSVIDTVDENNVPAADSAVVFQVHAGNVGQTYTLTCEIVTAAGNTVNRKATITVKDL